jgi:hypothetical protein
MKRSLPLYTLLPVILLSAFSLQSINSQPLLLENFDYPDGTDLSTVGWTIHSGTDNPITVTLPGLSFTGYALSNIGGTALLDANYIDVNKTFTAQTSGSVYAAFMVKVTNGAEGHFLHFGLNPFSSSTFFGRVWLKASGSDWVFGLSKTSNTPAAATTPITLGSTYLMVLKYEIVDGTANDLVSLYYFNSDVPATEPTTPNLTAADGTSTDYNPGAIALRQYSANQNIQVDGIRIATSWAEAVTAAISTVDNTPPTFAAGFPKLSNINETQADLEVNINEPGKAYYIVVPDGATAPTVAEVAAGTNYGTVTLTAHGTIDVTAGGGTYSATISGLTDKTDYDIYVAAEDDETTPNRQTEVAKVDLYTVRPPDVLLNADFETAGSLAPFTQVSITGDQIWNQYTFSGSSFARISGFASGAKDNEDWLISPAVNISSAESVMLSFLTARDFDGGTFVVKVSSNFSGTYTATDIASAAWTDITSNFALSADNYEWIQSGEFSLAAYTGNVYIAFVYTSTTEGAATWEVDDVRITGYLLPGSDASLSDLKVDGTTIASFDAATLSYEMTIEASVTTPPAVTYSTTDATATAVVNNAADLSGDATARTTTVVVTAANGTTTQTYSILFNPIIAVADLAALRAVSPDNYGRIYQVTGQVVVSGINDTQRHQKYVQDASAGILIDDATGIITTAYSVGDGITGLTGTLSEYSKLLQFIPDRDPGTASSTGNVLTPQVVTVTEFTANQENYESELVRIVGVTFADANGTAAFEEKKNYSITVGTDATILRTIFLGTDLNGKIIPYMADVTGIATVFNTDAQITPRNYADLTIYSSDATLSDLKVNGTSVTGFASGTLTYNVSLPAGTTAIPAVTATPAEANAAVIITPATALTGDAAARTAKIDVTSQDKSSVKNYTIVFSVATGIDDNQGKTLRLYPVPARDEITAEGIEGVTLIEIFEVTGNKVTAIRCEGDTVREIPLTNLPRGLYVMKLTTPDGVVMKKFVKD